MRKLRLGLFSFTCDEGCMVTFLEILNTKFFKWKDLVEIKSARILKSKNAITEMDVAVIEGAISTKEEEELLKKIRENSKFVIAIGSCAINGSPSNFRNSFNSETKEKLSDYMKKFGYRETVSPLSEIIKIDEQVAGCPMMEEKFVEVFEKYMYKLGVL